MTKLPAPRRDRGRRPGVEPLEARALLSLGTPTDPATRSSGPTPVLRLTATPNDPQFTGGNMPALDGPFGVNAPGAWDVTTGSPATVVIADVDTGVDYNHPDLYRNIWLNQAEIPASRVKNLTDVYRDGYLSWRDLNDPANVGPGKITDLNGDGRIGPADVLAPMVKNADGTDSGQGGWGDPGNVQDGDTAHPNDLIGWNFVDNTNDPLDLDGHGTQTAGVIAASGNNGLGVVGVNWSARVMALKVFDANGNGSTADAASALLYAARHGARVANASWGASGTSQALRDAVAAAGGAGVVLVASAGNGSVNTDTQPFYPAAFRLPNEVVVTAADAQGRLAPLANYGAASVDLAAPGVGILTTAPGGTYATASGTSMAAPFVTGTVALVAGLHPTWTAAQLVRQVLATVTPDPALAGRTATGGLVNAAAAVGPVAIPLPPAVTWPAPADVTYGTPLGAAQLAASASVAGTFSYSPPAGTVLNAGAGQTLTATFTPADAAHYTPVTAVTTINVVRANPVLAWPSPADVTYGTPLGASQLAGVAWFNGQAVPGRVAYTPAPGTVLHAGAGQVLSATFTPTDLTDFSPATATTTLTVRKGSPPISWPAPAAIVYGTPLGPAQLNASSPVAGTFSYTTAAGTVPGAGLTTLLALFTPSDGADYATTFAAATVNVNRSRLTVSADNKSRRRGVANPALTYTLVGFVNGDTPAVVTGAPILSTPASPASAAGSYPIAADPGTLAAANYDVASGAAGVLTVTGAPGGPAADFDGDGKTDPTVLRPANDLWISRPSAGGGVTVQQFGDPARHDVPAPADYGGTGRADLAVYRPSSAAWIVRPAGGSVVVQQFGDPARHDVPAPADYEGIGKADLAVYRPATGQWIVRLAGGSVLVQQFGDPAQNDVPVPADYEGTGRADLAVYRPATGEWIVRLANGAVVVQQFGDPARHDVPVPGDFDGDGRADLAVYRPATGQWIVRGSSAGVTVGQFGDPAAGDLGSWPSAAPAPKTAAPAPRSSSALVVTPAAAAAAPQVIVAGPDDLPASPFLKRRSLWPTANRV